MATLPKITYIPNATTGLTSIAFTKPNSTDFPVSSSKFPTETDTFKFLKYQAPNETIMRQQLSQYHTLMAKITSGAGTTADVDALRTLAANIRDNVLTEDDYNLMVTAISNLEVYINNFLGSDLNKKAQRLDDELKLAIQTLNTFMTELETAYNNYPSGWPPVADNTITFNKLTTETQAMIQNGGVTTGALISDTKPALPVQGKAIIWIDTNIDDAD